MSDRPSVDDLKERRDGTLSAGPDPRRCWICEKKVLPGEDVVRSFVDGADSETGRRTGGLRFGHAECVLDEGGGDG